MEEPDIPLRVLLSGPKPKKDDSSIKQVYTWKWVTSVSPTKTKPNKKLRGGLAAPFTTSAFVKNLMHTSPNEVHFSP
ncbi:hypothetical protein PanWU01x14_012890 [Parasponia andersonii]|uniref:Uncharacterized protein n=1 Tax=Parasponia andersonii TaxID=3476 RepID=A0A2P5E0W4_PARAD|nr:hypothetical protein PanWU01x14_012890 [Parasponia andersonii]